MTDKKRPTDAEIAECVREASVKCVHPDAVTTLDIARAVLDKWGPPPMAWDQGSLVTMNQDPYPALGRWHIQFWEGEEVAARVYGNDFDTLRRRCASIAMATAPKPPVDARPFPAFVDGLVWLCTRQSDGTIKPLDQTAALTVPQSWKQASRDYLDKT